MAMKNSINFYLTVLLFGTVNNGGFMKFFVFANDAGGLYRFRYALIKTIVDSGHEVVIADPLGDEMKHFSDIGCKLYDIAPDRRGMNPIKDLLLMFRYIKVIKKEAPDKIITYTIKPNIYAGIAARLLKKQYYSNVTGLGTAFQKEGILKKFTVALYKTALKRSSCVFFENSSNKDTFVSLGIVNEDKTCVLKGAGVDVEHFVFEEYPKESESLNFIFIGRIMKEKGIDELFYAFERLKSEYENIKLTVLGYYEEAYEDKIKTLTEKGLLDYKGNQDDVRPFIKESHCFVLPSYHEGMANTILECGAMGRPVITSDIPGCKEGVIDKKSGFLCKAQDKEDLYHKMKEFILLSYEEKREMGKMSNEHITREFDKKDVVDKTLKNIM